MLKTAFLSVAAIALCACSGPEAPKEAAAAAAPSMPTASPAAPPAMEAKDIVDTAASVGSFNTLVAAVKAAGLETTLKGSGPFTVFAPTDAAFAALPAGAVDDLLKPENKDKLVKILTYHVLASEVPSNAVAGKTLDPATVEGGTLRIVGKADGAVTVNDATVTQADVDASNGVIHVIDKVLLPPAM